MRSSRIVFSVMFSIIALFAVVAYSCTSEPIRPTTSFSDHFPQRVGFQWLYQITDSLTGQIDSAMVRIVDFEIDSSGIGIWMWEFNRGGALDTHQVTVQEGAVGISGPLSSHLQFPMSLGKIWSAGDLSCPQQMTIVDSSTFVVFSHAYQATFRVVGESCEDISDYALHQDIQIAINTGIVSYYTQLVTIAGITVQEHWELVSRNF